ncbi:uncharacterized protein LOC142230979 [Haematobia irritans]|uniref:uncharacterized protein LOC142230979 n=1 Tax=Haematobia irritans TaxID=7368 RepID=UPI003F4FC63F
MASHTTMKQLREALKRSEMSQVPRRASQSLLSSSDTLIVLGDFNLPYVSWLHSSESESLIPVISNSISNNFLHSLLNLGLFQINDIFNSHGRLLDLVFVNRTFNISLESCHALTQPEDRYHPTIILHVAAPNLPRSRYTNSNREYCFAKTNYTILNSLLSAVNWDDILDSNDITELASRFYSILQDCISKSVPRIIINDNSGPPWNTRVLSKLKNQKNKMYNQDYLNRMKDQLRVDPKSFYKFVNSKRQSSGLPTYLKYKSSTADNDVDISNIIADFFATTYSDKCYDGNNIYPYMTRNCNRIDISYIDESTILSNLRTLKSTFNAGPDGIPSCILKQCADILSYPLSLLFNKSLKLMEKILTSSISHQISSLLSANQHGFRKKRSTITNLLEFTCLVNDAFRDRFQTDTIYTDFSKAFDKVNHALLLHKLDMIGFSEPLLRWFHSYLIGRTQYVKLVVRHLDLSLLPRVFLRAATSDLFYLVYSSMTSHQL